DNALAMSASAHRDRASGQVSLFDALMPEQDEPQRASKTPAVERWSQTEKLAYEKELLAFYVTGHPLDDYRSLLESGKFTPIVSLGELEDKSPVKIAGSLTSVEKKF